MLKNLFKTTAIAVFSFFITDAVFAQHSESTFSVTTTPVTSLPSVKKSPVLNKSNAKKEATQLLFTENKGQLADEKGRLRPDVLFTASSKGASLFIGAGELTYQFQKETFPKGYVRDMRKAKDTALEAELSKKIKRETCRFSLSLVGANKSPVIIKSEQNIFTQNFYLSQCPDGITGVQSFGRLVMKDIYPGIDWVLYSKNGGFVYDFIVHPGSDPSLIKLNVKDVKSSITASGELIFKTALGTIKESAPASFCGKEKIPSSFHKNNDGSISFIVKKYNNNKDLLIDPVVNWSTYYGGTGWDYGLSLSTDPAGNIYVVCNPKKAFRTYLI